MNIFSWSICRIVSIMKWSCLGIWYDSGFYYLKPFSLFPSSNGVNNFFFLVLKLVSRIFEWPKSFERSFSVLSIQNNDWFWVVKFVNISPIHDHRSHCQWFELQLSHCMMWFHNFHNFSLALLWVLFVDAFFLMLDLLDAPLKLGCFKLATIKYPKVTRFAKVSLQFRWQWPLFHHDHSLVLRIWEISEQLRVIFEDFAYLMTITCVNRDIQGHIE